MDEKSPTRQHLPPERHGTTHTVVIGDRKVKIITGEFGDGSLGEVFIEIGKEGGEMRVYDCFAISISIALQYGVPLEAFTEKFKNQTMEPCGVTDNDDIPLCSSVVDYLAKWLELKYLTADKLDDGIDDSSQGSYDA